MKAQEQFVALLREMFQIQDLDLDFGIYRVLRQEKELIEEFLKTRLTPIVRAALGAADESQRDAIDKKLHEQIETRRRGGDSEEEIENSSAIKKLRAELDGFSTSNAMETDVYNGLAEFFSRYYDKGDFLSRPRYKQNVYALPYNGEEVKLHWANRDQYYIKSAQVLETFDWSLPTGGGDLKVRFQLREAGHSPNNTKEERRFVLALDDDENPVAVREGDVLTIFFDFKKTTGGARDLNADAEARLRNWQAGRELVAPILAPWSTPGTAPGKSHFLHRLNSWTARGSFDFFIHKNLRGFLERELDFFLKNEVVSLDALFAGDGEAWEKTTLAKAQAMHALGRQLIAFLASLEELQKRLWEKQKWIVQSELSLPLGLVPAALLPDVLKNAAQLEEWKTLYQLDSAPTSLETPIAWSKKLAPEWAAQFPDVAVDTKHFGIEWTRRLLTELSQTHTLDELWTGVLWNADNFAALNLMQKRFKEQVKCIYIDPPYNTGGEDFLYKDAYQHSSWLSMMNDRLKLAREIMSNDAMLHIHIGDDENNRLRMLLEDNFVRKNSVVVRRGVKNVQAQFDDIDRLNVGHDIVHVCTKNNIRLPHLRQSLEVEKEGKWDTFWRGTDRVTMRYDLLGVSPETGQWRWETGRAHKAVENYKYFLENESRSKTLDEWYIEKLQVNQDLDFVRINEDGVIQYFVPPQGFRLVSDNWLDISTTGTSTDFAHEKSTVLLNRVINWNCSNNDLILDYFAGSGTTGHAVLNLNRADKENGRRQYLLVEQGQYFDSVLVPRLKKAAFAAKWKDGRPAEYSGREGVAQTLWRYRLESYEDALEHLAAVTRDNNGQLQLEAPDDDFTVRYALEADTRGGALPLSDEIFRAPFAMKMHVGGDDAGESTPVTLDALATFNWLLGLRVHKLWFPTNSKTPNKTSGEAPKIGAVCGLLPDDRAAVIVWRTLDNATFEASDAALLEFWQHDAILKAWRETYEVQVVYLNGDSTAWRSQTQSENWTLEPAESTFRELMFATSPQAEGI